MRLLDRYLLRELFVPLGYCLVGFFLFWVSFDLFSELETFQRRALHFKDIGEYYLVKSPELLVTVLPVAFLLALLYALGNHTRHNELTAFRAAGVSLWRIAVPYLSVGALFSLTLLFLNEACVPDGNEAANRILRRYEVKTPGALDEAWYPNLAFLNEASQRKWSIGAFNRETGEMLAPNVEWVQPDGTRRRLTAERAHFSPDGWVFESVKEFLYQASRDVLPVPSTNGVVTMAIFTESPDEIRSEIKYSELSNIKLAKRPRLSMKEIVDYQRLHPHLRAAEREKLQTQFHGRLAEPWTCLVVVLIALPFATQGGRRNAFVGVASSIFIGFTYFILSRVGLALGTGGYLQPAIAAWLPNVMFALAGILMTGRIR